MLDIHPPCSYGILLCLVNMMHIFREYVAYVLYIETMLLWYKISVNIACMMCMMCMMYTQIYTCSACIPMYLCVWCMFPPQANVTIHQHITETHELHLWIPQLTQTMHYVAYVADAALVSCLRLSCNVSPGYRKRRLRFALVGGRLLLILIRSHVPHELFQFCEKCTIISEPWRY